MSSSYPAGVTGNEYEIAGADGEMEIEIDVECDEHEETFPELRVEAEYYAGDIWALWTCPVCGIERMWMGDLNNFR